MKVLCVGDIDESLSIQSHAVAENSQLVTSKNFDLYLADDNSTWYTSLGDLGSPDQLEHALLSADQIIYFEPTSWSHQDCKTITEYFLFKHAWHKSIKNFKPSTPDPLKIFSSLEPRKTTDPQLWAVGCSVTFGFMLDDRHKWANVLASKLQIKQSLLAMPGSGIDWQARQILNADMLPGDTVCWLMPSFNRYEITNNFSVLEKPKHFSMGAYEEQQSWFSDFVTNNKVIKKIFPKLHGSDEYRLNLNWFARCHYPYQILVNHLNLVKQVVNCCQNNIKLYILTQKFTGDVEQEHIIDHYLSTMCSGYLGKFEYDYSTWPDYAQDNVHPGQHTHQLFADKFYQAIVS